MDTSLKYNLRFRFVMEGHAEAKVEAEDRQALFGHGRLTEGITKTRSNWRCERPLSGWKDVTSYDAKQTLCSQGLRLSEGVVGYAQRVFCSTVDGVFLDRKKRTFKSDIRSPSLSVFLNAGFSLRRTPIITVGVPFLHSEENSSKSK